MNKKILVIEDQNDVRDSIKTILELNNYTVIEASNGAEGLDKLTETHPDIILCDVMMPVMDGFKFLEEIRSVGNETPLIFLTAKAQYEDLKTGMNLGADDYLFKPFKSVDLLKSIDKRLNRKNETAHLLNVWINNLEATVDLIEGTAFAKAIQKKDPFVQLVRSRASNLTIAKMETYSFYIEQLINRLKNSFQKISSNEYLYIPGKTECMFSLILENIASAKDRSADIKINGKIPGPNEFNKKLISIAFYEVFNYIFDFSDNGEQILINITDNTEFCIIEIQTKVSRLTAAELIRLSDNWKCWSEQPAEIQNAAIGFSLASLILGSQMAELHYEDQFPNGVMLKLALKK